MDGVLIIGYGAPQSLDEIKDFMTSLTGREPSEALLERMRARYESIGGGSPLVPTARELASLLEKRFTARGVTVPVEIGMVHTAPYVDQAVDNLIECGVTRIIALSLSPFYSTASNGTAFERAAQSVQRYDAVTLECAPEIGLMPGFIKAHAHAMEDAFERLDIEDAFAPLAFSAHSLPLEAVEAGDYVYEEGLRKAADAVAEALCLAPADEQGYQLGDQKAYGTEQLPRPWCLVFQSKGVRGDHWLEPTLDAFIENAAERGKHAVMSIPLGFATDHLETLYDLDVAARNKVSELDMIFVRSAAPNTSDELVDAMLASIDEVREA